MQPCLTPAIVGKGKPILLFNKIKLVEELYNDVMILIGLMCIPIFVKAFHLSSCHTLSKYL